MVHYKVQFKSPNDEEYHNYGGNFDTLEEAIVKFKELDKLLSDSPHHYKDYLARIVKVTPV